MAYDFISGFDPLNTNEHKIEEGPKLEITEMKKLIRELIPYIEQMALLNLKSKQG